MKVIPLDELVSGSYYWVFCDGFVAPYVAGFKDGKFWIPGQESEVSPEEMQHCFFTEVHKPSLVTTDKHTEFLKVNFRCAFPKFVEGYWRKAERVDKEALQWRSQVERNESRLPWPVVLEIAGYDKEDFIARLDELQAHAQKELYRGITVSRLTGEPLGNAEYELNEWTWPGDYIHYLKAGVPPSRAFYKFVTDRDLDTLPKYGRE